MRRRRIRFTATLAQPGNQTAKEVVLAYDARGARDYFTKRGHQVLRVEKGDYRCDVSQNGGGWALDHAAFEEAIKFLGIEWDVNVKQTHRHGGRQGAHTVYAREPMRHTITVKSWLTVKQAGEALWHELCHAMQVERTARTVGATSGPAVLAAWNASSECKGSYQHRPIEVEARSYEHFNDEQPLAKAPAGTLARGGSRR